MSFETILVDTTPRVVTITINRPERNNSINAGLVRDLNAALDAAEASPTCRAVVLQGRPGLFCTGMDFVEAAKAQGGANDMMEIGGYMGVLKRFASSPKVIISKLDGKVVAGGVGFAAASDLVIATPRTDFSLSEALWGILPCCVIPFLIRRVGFQKAYAMTLTTNTWTATEAAAIHLVDELTETPDESIRKLMLRLGRLEDETIVELKGYFQKMWILSPQMEQTAVAEISRLVEKPKVRKGIGDFVATGKFPLGGPAMSMSPQEAVKLSWVEGGIAVVALEDREAKNFFSDGIFQGVINAFNTIAATPTAKVVVVHGYDSYFSCGGSRDQLIAISENKIKYTDFTFFDQLRRCELPCIAAMQGHSIGGGLAFGLHGDFHVFAEECIYSANFMEYGFTPGMGTTFTVPRFFGEELGWEMLFTAGNYRGAELKARGAPIIVKPRLEVVPHALAQARLLATKPVVALKELKRRRLELTQADFETAVRREVEMHKVTFAIPEVQAKIRTMFRE